MRVAVACPRCRSGRSDSRDYEMPRAEGSGTRLMAPRSAGLRLRPRQCDIRPDELDGSRVVRSSQVDHGAGPGAPSSPIRDERVRPPPLRRAPPAQRPRRLRRRRSQLLAPRPPGQHRDPRVPARGPDPGARPRACRPSRVAALKLHRSQTPTSAGALPSSAGPHAGVPKRAVGRRRTLRRSPPSSCPPHAARAPRPVEAVPLRP